MPWESAPPFALIVVMVGGMGGIQQAVHKLFNGGKPKAVGVDAFDRAVVARDKRIREEQQEAKKRPMNFPTRVPLSRRAGASCSAPIAAVATISNTFPMRRIGKRNWSRTDAGRRASFVANAAAAAAGADGADGDDEATAAPQTRTKDPTAAIRAMLAHAVSNEDYREAARLQRELELADPSILLRKQLEDAVAGERYDDAARIKTELDALLPRRPKFEPVPTSSDAVTRGIRVRVKSFFVAGQSSVGTYTFAYRIKITNEGEEGGDGVGGDDEKRVDGVRGDDEKLVDSVDGGSGRAQSREEKKSSKRAGKTYQLLSRTWHIVDGGDGTEDNPRRIERVRGPGVVGETPVLGPGESFSYSSFAQLRTPAGSMRGSYTFVEVEKGTEGGVDGEGEGERREGARQDETRTTNDAWAARAVGEEFDVEIGEFGLDERDASPPTPGTM